MAFVFLAQLMFQETKINDANRQLRSTGSTVDEIFVCILIIEVLNQSSRLFLFVFGVSVGWVGLQASLGAAAGQLFTDCVSFFIDADDNG